TSHDREFMNRLVSKIAEIDGGEITAYSGNYDFYERERAVREANREAAYARQQAMLAKEQRFIERFAAHAAKAAQVQSRVKALEKIEKIELPKKRRVVKFDFRQPPRSGDIVATLEHLAKAYGRRVVHADLSLKIRSLSGGEKTRLVMARMLLNPPNFLVLDEPTNHLDLATKEMLIDALKDFEGTMLFVSHDREFLRGLSNRVLELGGETGTDVQAHSYPGSYVEYVARTGHEAPGVHG